MNIKASVLYVAKILYRSSILLLTVPLELILRISFPNLSFIPLHLANLLCFLVIVLYSLKGRKKTRLLREDNLVLQRGVFFEEATCLTQGKASLFLVLRKPFYPLFKSRKLLIADEKLHKSIYLSSAHSQAIIKSEKHFCLVHKSGGFRILAVTLGISNLLPEALAVVLFFRKTFSLLEAQSGDVLIKHLEKESAALLRFLPYSLRFFALVLFFILSASLLTSFLNLFGLTLFESKGKFLASFGVLNKATATFEKAVVSALTESQNLLSLLLSLRLIYAHLPIKGRYKKLPLAVVKNKKELWKIRESLGFSNNEKTKLTLYPQSLWGYVYPSVLFLSSVFALFIFSKFFPHREMLHALLLPLLLFGVFRFFISFFGFQKTSLRLYENYISIESVNSFSLRKSFIPLSRITAFTVKQTPFGRLFDRCTLILHTCSASPLSFKITHIERTKAAQLLSLCGLDSFYSVLFENKQLSRRATENLTKLLNGLKSYCFRLAGFQHRESCRSDSRLMGKVNHSQSLFRHKLF